MLSAAPSVEIGDNRTALLPKTVSPADFDKYIAEANAWLNEANDWILKNLGAAASARFLDTGGGLSLSWERAANPQHNGMINSLIKHRENLTKMIEVNAWDSGDAERPLSRSSLERKFMNFAVPVVSKAGAERVVSLVDGLEELKDVRELTRALRGSGKQNPA
jgi:hypothetical protein